jgi:hypothetical protein
VFVRVKIAIPEPFVLPMRTKPFSPPPLLMPLTLELPLVVGMVVVNEALELLLDRFIRKYTVR